MAGIGFELNKLFQGKSMISKIRAYGYTCAVTTGPMLLGILFMLLISWTGQHYGLGKADSTLFVAIITYILLFSLILSSIFSIVDTRFAADMIYIRKKDDLLSSFYGTLCLLLPAGAVLSGIFLLTAGIGKQQAFLTFFLFLIVLVVWTQETWLTIQRNYKGILGGYALAVAAAVLTAWIVSYFLGTSVSVLLESYMVGYGVMMISNMILLHRYFPDQGEKPFLFLRWFDKNPQLAWSGLLINIGLYSHIIVAWHSRLGVQITHSFYIAPSYDGPVLLAFLSTIVTVVGFIVSAEVHFYPVYRNYYDLLNSAGTITEIRRSEKHMLKVLKEEVRNLVLIQIATTVLFLFLGPLVLEQLPIVFTDAMEWHYRILCLGYGAYAVGQVLVTFLSYYTDDTGVFRASVLFACVTTGTSVVFSFLPLPIYSLAFTIGSGCLFFYAGQRLMGYTHHLGYHALSSQPWTSTKKEGFFTKMEKRLDHQNS